jgi:hypothetical protein
LAGFSSLESGAKSQQERVGKVALYLISYDINEKDKAEYAGLWAHLRKIGATKILYSEWVVKGNKDDAGSIYDDIVPLIRPKDRLLVQEVTFNAAWDKLLIADDDFHDLLVNATR